MFTFVDIVNNVLWSGPKILITFEASLFRAHFAFQYSLFLAFLLLCGLFSCLGLPLTIILLGLIRLGWSRLDRSLIYWLMMEMPDAISGPMLSYVPAGNYKARCHSIGPMFYVPAIEGIYKNTIINLVIW